MNQIIILELLLKFFENQRTIFRRKLQGLNENCIGFSGFTESLLLESFIKKANQKILIPKYIDIELKKSTKKGFITFQAIKKLNKKQIKTEAIKQGCGYFFLIMILIRLNKWEM